MGVGSRGNLVLPIFREGPHSPAIEVVGSTSKTRRVLASQPEQVVVVVTQHPANAIDTAFLAGAVAMVVVHRQSLPRYVGVGHATDGAAPALEDEDRIDP